MRVNLTGYCFRHPSDFRIHRPHGSGDHLLLVVRSAATFELNGQTVHTPPGTVLLLDKGMPQMYGGDGGEFVNDWVHFTPDETMPDLPWGVPIEWGDVRELSDLIARIVDAFYSPDGYREAIMSHYLSLLLLRIAQHQSGESINALTRLRTEIYNDPAQEWTVPRLSAKAALSISYFQHIYKKTFGVSVMEDVIAARIEHAKYLLSRTDRTVSVIARDCGYENEVHFMRQFKARTNKTPSQWRNTQ
jgi:AraC family transcriptional regulator of arabinose operon